MYTSLTLCLCVNLSIIPSFHLFHFPVSCIPLYPWSFSPPSDNLSFFLPLLPLAPSSIFLTLLPSTPYPMIPAFRNQRFISITQSVLFFHSFPAKDSESPFSFHQFSTLIHSCSLFIFYPLPPHPLDLYDSNMFQLRCGSAEKGRWLTRPVSSSLSHLWPVHWLKPTGHTTLLTVAWFVDQQKWK